LILGTLEGFRWHMVDSIVAMNTAQYSTACIALDHFVGGQGVVSPGMLVGNVPAWFEYDNVRFMFHWRTDERDILVMEYIGLNNNAETIRYKTFITAVDFARWNARRQEALSGNRS
jgi:hypothetical protein